MSSPIAAGRCARSMNAGSTRSRKPSPAVRSKVDSSVTEHLRAWLAETNSSSQVLMEALAKARGLNEKVIKQLQVRTKHEEHGDRDAARACGEDVLSGGRETVAALRQFEQQIAQNIQEDQRIIVVDAEGFVLGLVVDHVNEVLNVPQEPAGTAAAHHIERRDGTVGSRQTGRRRPADHAAGRGQSDEGPETA